MPHPTLVSIHDHSLLGSNFYWHKYEKYGLSKTDLAEAGVTDERVFINPDLIEPLKQADADLQKHGFRLYIKEGYRSQRLYELVFERRSEKFGKEETTRLFNMENMPHANGTSVDIALWDPKINSEVYLRNGKDGTDALFVDFYRSRPDPEALRYQELQDLLISTMTAHGFALGTKNEYFHFDFKR